MHLILFAQNILLMLDTHDYTFGKFFHNFYIIYFRYLVQTQISRDLKTKETADKLFYRSKIHLKVIKISLKYNLSLISREIIRILF